MGTTKNGKRIGRPPKEIDPKTVERLARIHCTLEEIASVCNCSVDTLHRRFADVIERGKESGKASLRRLQWKAARGGNVTMLIWLGKQMLAQSDQQNIRLSELEGLSDEELAALAAGKVVR